MQLKKQQWKSLRDTIPCRVCGKVDHATKECVTRRGKKRGKNEH